MTIAEREEMVAATVKKLRSIKTLKKYKESKYELMDLMEKVFRSASEVLKSVCNNLMSLSPEEQKSISESLQDDNFLLHPDIIKEFDRLENMPGAKEFSDSFSMEMQERMSPYLNEFAEQMGKLMENFMGGLMGGIADAMSGLAGEQTTEEDTRTEFDPANPDTPEALYLLYISRNLDEFRASKESFIDYLVHGKLQDHQDTLEYMASKNFSDLWDQDIERLEEIRNLASRLEPELKKEFMRFSSIRENAEESEKIRKELWDLINPKLNKIKKYLAAAGNCVATFNRDGSSKN